MIIAETYNENLIFIDPKKDRRVMFSLEELVAQYDAKNTGFLSKIENEIKNVTSPTNEFKYRNEKEEYRNEKNKNDDEKKNDDFGLLRRVKDLPEKSDLRKKDYDDQTCCSLTNILTQKDLNQRSRPTEQDATECSSTVTTPASYSSENHDIKNSLSEKSSSLLFSHPFSQDNASFDKIITRSYSDMETHHDQNEEISSESDFKRSHGQINTLLDTLRYRDEYPHQNIANDGSDLDLETNSLKRTDHSKNRLKKYPDSKQFDNIDDFKYEFGKEHRQAHLQGTFYDEHCPQSHSKDQLEPNIHENADSVTYKKPSDIVVPRKNKKHTEISLPQKGELVNFGITKCGSLFFYENKQLTLITKNFKDILMTPRLYKDMLLTASRRTVNHQTRILGTSIILIIDVFYIQIKSLKNNKQEIMKYHSVFAPVYHVDTKVQINYDTIRYYNKTFIVGESVRFLYTLTPLNNLHFLNKVISKLNELNIQEPSEIILKGIGICLIFVQIFFYLRISLKNTRVTGKIVFKKDIAYTYGIFNKRQVVIKRFTEPDVRSDNETKILTLLHSSCFLKYMFIEETGKKLQFVRDICGVDLYTAIKNDFKPSIGLDESSVSDGTLSVTGCIIKDSENLLEPSLINKDATNFIDETSRSDPHIVKSQNFKQNISEEGSQNARPNKISNNPIDVPINIQQNDSKNINQEYSIDMKSSFYDEFGDSRPRPEMNSPTLTLSTIRENIIDEFRSDLFKKQKQDKRKIQFCYEIVQIFVQLHREDIAYCNTCPENIFYKNKCFFLANFEECYSDAHSNTGFLESLQNMGKTHELGTENYRGPEIIEHNRFKRPLTVGECKKSDIFSLAIIFHQIITGKHPFCNYPASIEDNVLHNNYSLSTDLSGPVSDLLHHMLKKACENRLDIFQISKHPVFWSNDKIYNFFATLSDLLEFHGETSLRIYSRLERNKFKIFHGKWIHKLDDILVNELRAHRIYNFNNVKGLIRAIRNKGRHYKETIPSIRNLFISFPDGFIDYFTRRFPNLLMVCFYSAKTAANDELLSIFF